MVSPVRRQRTERWPHRTATAEKARSSKLNKLKLMTEDEIEESILRFADEFVGQNFRYVNDSDKIVRITDVGPSKGAAHEGEREGRVTLSQIREYTQEFAKGGAVHIEQAIGSSSNNRSVVEALMAHHPQVVVCYQPKPSGTQNSKHTRWFDYVVHRPGRMLRRDDWGTRQTSGQPETSGWAAPEWCLAVDAARYLEENPSDEDELCDLLDQSTGRSGWSRKVELLKSVRSDENSTQDFSSRDRGQARWYLDFSRGDYGSWNDYFDGTSPEEGLAEKVVSTVSAGDQLCNMLGLNSPEAVSSDLPSAKMLDMFVEELRRVGMHVDRGET